MTNPESTFSTVSKWTIDPEYVGQRLDNYLTSRLKRVPKSKIYRIIRKGELRINGKRVKPDYRLQVDDLLRLPPIKTDAVNGSFQSNPDGPPAANLTKSHFPVRSSLVRALQDPSVICYEDSGLLVLNKPAGAAVHGGSRHPWGVIEVMRQLMPQYPYLELVHRLDRDTSGLLMLAKKRWVLKALHATLTSHRMDKRYLLLVHGQVVQDAFKIDMPLSKNFVKGGERVTRADLSGKNAETRVVVQQRFRDHTLLEAQPKTGRTHQLRVHLAEVGHPIVGDGKYGDAELDRHFKQRYQEKRMWLHAHQLKLPPLKHPEQGSDRDAQTFCAPLGDALQRLLAQLDHA